MKKVNLFILLFSIFYFLFALCSHAQAPQSFNYQLIARDTSGAVYSNQSLGLQISILKDASNGAVVYSERHAATTNKFGLVNLEIGNGSIVLGNFQTIDWGAHTYYIKLEIDPDGGTNYFTLGTTQLVSVPYSLYAAKAGNVVDTSNTNELQALSLSNDTLYLTKGGFVKLPAGTSADWTRDGNNLYNNNTGNVGIGTSAPSGKLIVQGDSSASAAEPLLEVKNKAGEAVFVVYQDSVKVIIPKNSSKATAQGGFAVSGRSSAKGDISDYLVITPDSARIYLDSSPDKASAQGGFAVSGRSSSKGGGEDYLSVNSDSVKVSKSLLIPRMTQYERDNLGFTPSEALIIFNMTDECMQIYKNGEWSNIWCFHCSPSIITQPFGATICSNEDTSYTISATGTSLIYQWQQSTDAGNSWSDISNSGVYSGANTWNLSLHGVPVGYNGYRYRCTVTGSCAPDVISNSVVLNVGSTPPAIISPPSDQVLTVDCNAGFSIQSIGFGVNYRWQWSADGTLWTDIENGGSEPYYWGATEESISLSNVPLAYNGYQYRCRVSNSCGAPTFSASAFLTVNTPPEIATHPANKQLSTDCAASFSISVSAGNVTYQWQESADNGNSWTDIIDGGSGPVYSGAVTANLSLANVPMGYNGFQYRCVVSHFCRPNSVSDAATLSAVAPAIAVQPSGQHILPGQSTGFGISVTGNGIGYEWQESADGGSVWENISNGGTAPTYSGVTTANLSLVNVPAGYNNYKYRCIVSTLCGPAATSDAAGLSVVACTAVTDIDGNTYNAVAIGTQCWMKENIKTTRYRDGSPIPYVTDMLAWGDLVTGARMYFNFDSAAMAPVYGALYNWYAAGDARHICPAGWHVPSDVEWMTLYNFIGGVAVAGGALKEAGTDHWNSPNTGATNSSGFTALGSGYYYNWTFYQFNNYAMWWSSKDEGANAWRTVMTYDAAWANGYGVLKHGGHSVRCIRD